MRYASLVFLCLVWGTTWIAIKITLEGMPPFFGAAARFLVAALFLFFFAKAKKVSLALNKKYVRIIGISAFLMYVLDYGFVYWGEQYLTAGVTSIFFATFTLFTTIWSNFLFKSEHFRWNTFGGIVIGFIGIMIVFYDQLLATDFNVMVIWGSLAIIVGAASGAMAIVIIKK
jgi:drug/metabolite transporter (DMT)-like permease